jgi:hypothetical protein
MTRKKMAKRVWLNPLSSDDTGAIQAKGKYDEYWIDLSVDVWDCSRKITLDFSVLGPKSYKERIKKLDNLITLLEECKNFIEEVYPDYEKEKKEYAKKNPDTTI